jgi:transposase
MRDSEPPIHYLVGTPRGRLSKLEQDFLSHPWEKVRESVSVKLLSLDSEVYVLARSETRSYKEASMRRRRVKKLWNRLLELQNMKLSRDELLMKLGAAKKEAGTDYKLVVVSLPKPDEEVSAATFTFSINKENLKSARSKEGAYLLRSNIVGEDPAVLWQRYIQLTEIEEAFKNLKQDLALRPVFHQRDDRIEAHIFVAFLAYCLHVTLRQRARALAPGLTPRSVLDKLKTMQMLDVHLPTTDHKRLVLSRYTQPDKDVQLILEQLKLVLPAQPPPKIYSTKNSLPNTTQKHFCSEDFHCST